MDLVRCNHIWNNLLFSNFSNEKVVKQFDLLISESDIPEKDFRIFVYLMLEQTSSNEKALNFIKKKIQERLDFINDEIKRIKVDNTNANKKVVEIENSVDTFCKKGEALTQKFNGLPAKFALILQMFGQNISEEYAKKFIDDLENNSLEEFVKPFLTLNITSLGLADKNDLRIIELKNFYTELESVLVARLEYRKEKIKRDEDYNTLIARCAEYEILEDKLIAERDMLNELLKFLNEKTNNNPLQSNEEKILKNVKEWFNNPNVDSSIKNNIRFLANFQVDFMINDDGQIVIKELLFNDEIKNTIISFKNQEDYLLFKNLVERIKGTVIKKDDLDSYIEYLDEEHTYDYIKETLICLIFHGFFVEEHKTIDFVDDYIPEFIDFRLRTKLSTASYQTPTYVRSLQLLNTKVD